MMPGDDRRLPDLARCTDGTSFDLAALRVAETIYDVRLVEATCACQDGDNCFEGLLDLVALTPKGASFVMRGCPGWDPLLPDSGGRAGIAKSDLNALLELARLMKVTVEAPKPNT